MPGKRGRSGPPGNLNARIHGLYAMKKAMMILNGKAIDRRYKVGRALAEWRENLIRDLGGQDAVSTQQTALVDLAVKSKLLLDSIDSWLLSQPSLVNARKKALLPVVRERQQLADGLARYLGQLGLERRVKSQSLEEWLAQTGEGEDGEETQEQAEGVA